MWWGDDESVHLLHLIVFLLYFCLIQSFFKESIPVFFVPVFLKVYSLILILPRIVNLYFDHNYIWPIMKSDQ